MHFVILEIHGYYKFTATLGIVNSVPMFLIKQYDWLFLNKAQKDALEHLFYPNIIVLKNPIGFKLRHIEKDTPTDMFKVAVVNNFEFDN
uniref:Uncharacterized protein n=1 Tax=Parastrongyloides trichosuri TaxID=131310 RepID=A0A0N4ZA06_PARTI